MDAVTVLLVVLLVAATVTCGVAIWALREVAGASRSAKALADDARLRLVPLLDKADITIDATNAELLRVDAIITRFEDASVRVSSASGTISGIVNAPTEIVTEVADRVRRAWKDRKRSADADATADKAPDDSADEIASADETPVGAATDTGVGDGS